MQVIHNFTLVLDEATSNIDHEMERRLYMLCKEYGITLISITHHERLLYYHEILLRLDNNGGHSISTLRFQS